MASCERHMTFGMPILAEKDFLKEGLLFLQNIDILEYLGALVDSQRTPLAKIILSIDNDQSP